MTRSLKESLRVWFKKNAATLPWRLSDLKEKRNPYNVWISETMLQQTQVSTVCEYFIRWMNRFPNIQILAKASESEVFKYWQGLGYYSRARNILKTAQIIANLEEFPNTREELEALPGIGAYTAGAILSFAFHKKEAILDGNLIRIFSRMYELDFLPTDKLKKSSSIYWDYAKSWANHPKGYMHNEALMELGQKICKIKNPQCNDCPLKEACRAFLNNRVQEFPPTKKNVQKNWHGTALLIESADGNYLAIRGGQPFFKADLCLPHFENSRNATLGIPSQAENYISANDIANVMQIGKFRHNITIHKIECEVLHIKLNKNHKTIKVNYNKKKSNIKEIIWVSKTKATEIFANKFSLKALKKIEDKNH